MKKELLIEKGLTDEQAEAVLKIYNEVIKDYVPKTDYDTAKGQIDTLENTVKDRDKQLKDIGKNVGDNEELKNQITKLQNDNKTAAEKYKAEIEQLKINSAVDMALTKAGAKTLKACKALLDNDNIKLDDEGNITGLDEQIKSLAEAEDTKYLFSTETFKGAKIGNSGNDPEFADTSKMNYTELCAYMEKNPDAQI